MSCEAEEEEAATSDHHRRSVFERARLCCVCLSLSGRKHPSRDAPRIQGVPKSLPTTSPMFRKGLKGVEKNREEQKVAPSRGRRRFDAICMKTCVPWQGASGLLGGGLTPARK